MGLLDEALLKVFLRELHLAPLWVIFCKLSKRISTDSDIAIST